MKKNKLKRVMSIILVVVMLLSTVASIVLPILAQ